MLTHPRDSIPADKLQEATHALLHTLAQDEPEALLRAAQTLQSGGHPAETPSPAAVLAESYLALTGNAARGGAEAAQTYEFNHGGHVHFEVRAGSRRAANRIARAAVAALLDSDAPLGALPGPFPGHPQLRNVTFWLGYSDDELELEGTRTGE